MMTKMKLFMPLALAMLALTAWAQDTDTADEQLSDDWVQIVIGSNVFAGGYGTHYFYYDADEDGTLVLTGAASPGVAYTDSAITTLADDTNASYISGVKTSSTVVSSGTRYYFKASGIFSYDTTYTAELITESTALTLKSISPEEYSTISVTGTGIVTITFNLGVSYTDATLSVKSASESLTSNSSSKQVLSFEIKDVVYDWLTDGTAAEGDTLTLTVTGLCASSYSDKLYGDDGTLTLHFLCPDLPMTIESETLPETFLSYWMEGDEDGIMILTFSDSIYNGDNTTYQAGARLSFGSADDSDYYQESVEDITIDGNRLIIDFTGKLRTLEAMGSTSLYVLDSSGDATDELRTMNLKVYNVCDQDGEAAYSSVSGNLGSYSYSFDYKQLTADVSWEFTPENGTTLEGTDYIELAMTGYDVLQYDGVEIAYTYQDEAYTDTVAVGDVVIETDVLIADFTYLMIPVSEAQQHSVDVSVALINTSFTDGVERDAIEAEYDTFDFSLIYPVIGYCYEGLFEGDSVKATLGSIDDRVALHTLTVTNTSNDSIIIADAELTYDSSTDTWSYVVPAVYSLMDNIEYEFAFRLYESAGDSVPYASFATLITGTAEEDVSTGISNVAVTSADGGASAVYTIDGIRIADGLTNLPAGVYVINGRKVVMK